MERSRWARLFGLSRSRSWNGRVSFEKRARSTTAYFRRPIQPGSSTTPRNEYAGGVRIRRRALRSLQIDRMVVAMLIEFGAPDLVQRLMLAGAEIHHRPQPQIDIVHALERL